MTRCDEKFMGAQKTTVDQFRILNWNKQKIKKIPEKSPENRTGNLSHHR